MTKNILFICRHSSSITIRRYLYLAHIFQSYGYESIFLGINNADKAYIEECKQDLLKYFGIDLYDLSYRYVKFEDIQEVQEFRKTILNTQQIYKDDFDISIDRVADIFYTFDDFFISVNCHLVFYDIPTFWITNILIDVCKKHNIGVVSLEHAEGMTEIYSNLAPFADYFVAYGPYSYKNLLLMGVCKTNIWKIGNIDDDFIRRIKVNSTRRAILLVFKPFKLLTADTLNFELLKKTIELFPEEIIYIKLHPGVLKLDEIEKLVKNWIENSKNVIINDPLEPITISLSRTDRCITLNSFAIVEAIQMHNKVLCINDIQNFVYPNWKLLLKEIDVLNFSEFLSYTSYRFKELPKISDRFKKYFRYKRKNIAEKIVLKSIKTIEENITNENNQGKRMKFLKVNINYSEMLDDFFIKFPNVMQLSYDELHELYFHQYYWPSNRLEKALNKIYNWETNSLIFTLEDTPRNNIFFEKWCEKYHIVKQYNDRLTNLLMQIVYYKPDVIYLHEIWFYPEEFFQKIRFLLKDITIMGWDCAPGTYGQFKKLKYTDVIFTCSQEKKVFFKDKGINSICVGHFFDFEFLEKSDEILKEYDVVFAGTINRRTTEKRLNFLKELISRGLNLTIFANTEDLFLKDYCLPPVYGNDFLKILKKAKIVLNQHVQENIKYSGNIRMYETTGVGTLLLTDYKEDLFEKYKENDEIVVYKTIDEIIEKTQYYLENENLREKIAKNGQSRTLKSYSYDTFAKKIYEFVTQAKSNQTDLIDSQFRNIIKFSEPIINHNFEFSKSINKLISQIELINQKNSKIAIYGYGNVGKIVRSYLKNVTIICDQTIEPQSEEEQFCHPSELHAYEFDYIIITVLGRENKISEFLEKIIKIPSYKIVTLEI